MIIDVWKPVKYNGSIIKYILLDSIDINKTGYKVRYICDVCVSGVIHNTTSTSLLKNKWNSVDFQVCRRCRTKKSERDVKNTTITYNNFKSKLIDSGYMVLSFEDDFNKQEYPSQAKVLVKCNRGHIHYVIWNNFVNKGRRCRQCYDDDRYNKGVSSKNGWLLYNYLVRKYTEHQYDIYKDKINPDSIPRGDKFHLDHKVSIAEGFRNCIPVYIIGSHHNLEIIESGVNISKGKGCSISIDNLYDEYYEHIR
jgi:hypothetical protein